MQELLKTFDNPVNLSEWLSNEPSPHRAGKQGLRSTLQNKRRLKCIAEDIQPRSKPALEQGSICNHFQPRRLAKVIDNQVTSATGKTFSYDDNGNLTVITQSAGNIVLAYDYDSQLTQYTQGSTTLSYQYDALGNRIKKTQGTSTTKYIVDPNRGLPSVLCETDASGAITSYYVYGLGLISKIEGRGSALRKWGQPLNLEFD